MEPEAVMRRRDLVVWSSSGRYDGPAHTPRVQTRRFRGALRTGALLAVIGLIRLACLARARWRLAFGLSGTVLAAVGVMLSSAAALVPGIVVLLVALLLPPDPSTRLGCNAGWPRCWAEPCLPFFASPREPGKR